MIGIVIVAHGGLAREYLAAMEHVVGQHPGTVAITIGEDDDRAIKQHEIDAAVKAVDEGQGVVMVTDMFGSTPSNLAMGACTKRSQRVIYGANLPLLIKLAKARHLPIEEAVEIALTAGRKYIDSVNGPGPNGTTVAI